MKEFWLTIKVDSKLPDDEDYIPAGSTGRVIDMTIENGQVMFLLEFFDNNDNGCGLEWYGSDEIEDCDSSTSENNRAKNLEE